MMATITLSTTKLIQVTASNVEIESLEEIVELASTICGSSFYLDVSEGDLTTISGILKIPENVLEDAVLQITSF